MIMSLIDTERMSPNNNPIMSKRIEEIIAINMDLSENHQIPR